jgi:hypothetical protein
MLDATGPEGDVLGAIVQFLGPAIVQVFTEGCDGLVAGQAHAFTRSELCNGYHPFMQTDANFGTAVKDVLPGICNSQVSQYSLVGRGIPSFQPPGGISRTSMNSSRQ